MSSKLVVLQLINALSRASREVMKPRVGHLFAYTTDFFLFSYLILPSSVK